MVPNAFQSQIKFGSGPSDIMHKLSVQMIDLQHISESGQKTQHPEMSNQAVQVESIRVEEVGIQAELVLQEETKKDFKCEECGIRVSYAKSLKRHI